MFDGRLVRLRAFEQTDLDANHAFMNDYATLRDMLSGLPLPASYEDERRWLDQQTSYTRGEYQFAIEDGGGDLVGRAHVEAERLEGKARTGFYLMGIVAPFLVLSAISGVFSAFAVMCFIPFTMGLFMVLSDGVLHRSLLWWKRGAMQFANGFANGFMFALVSVWFASCSQRAMLSPYQMQ